MLFSVTLFLVNLLTQYHVPHYIIYHFIFSFYQGTAYLANPSEIPFLISHSRVVILCSLTALDITYLHKLQITCGKKDFIFYLFIFFASVWGCLGFMEISSFVFLDSWFFQNDWKRFIKETQSYFIVHKIIYIHIFIHTFLCYFSTKIWIFTSSSVLYSVQWF